MPRLNPEHMNIVKDMVNKGHYIGLLGFHVTKLEAGLARAEMNVEPKHMNPFMNIHGGVYASLMDHMTFWCAYGAMPEDMGYTTIDLHVDDLRSCNSGLLTIEARMIKQGSTLCLCEAEIRDEAGHLMAHGTSKLFCSPTLQNVQAMIDDVAPGTVLPPKFID